eukprot:GILI01004019.1.p2 GENE.GILI01004019.1~~GILI01004019.1.p2  ORF type:complete len:242 (+),score=114.59 GILI01004019.1:52-777(+)
MFSNKFASLSNRKGPKSVQNPPKVVKAESSSPKATETKAAAKPSVDSSKVASLAQLKNEAKRNAAEAQKAAAAPKKVEEAPVEETPVVENTEAVEGAETTVATPAAPVIIQKTMKEVEDERKKNSVVIVKKERKAEKQTEKFAVLKRDGAEVKVDVKVAEKPVVAAKGKAPVKAASKPAPKQVAKPKDDKPQTLTLSDFKAEAVESHGGRGGYRGRGGRGGNNYRQDKAVDVTSPKDFPSL